MCMYGYCRISQKKQSIERQIRNIKAEYPGAVIIEEAYTGTTTDRPQWNKLLKKVTLYNKGVNLVFLKEHHIDSDTYKKTLQGLITMTNSNVDFILEGINKYLMALAKEQVKIAFQQAEKEVIDLHQRTREGIETARLNGKQIGGKPGSKYNVKKSQEAKDKIRKYSKDFAGTLDDTEVITLTGVSRKTYYKYKKELREGV